MAAYMDSSELASEFCGCTGMNSSELSSEISSEISSEMSSEISSELLSTRSTNSTCWLGDVCDKYGGSPTLCLMANCLGACWLVEPAGGIFHREPWLTTKTSYSRGTTSL